MQFLRYPYYVPAFAKGLVYLPSYPQLHQHLKPVSELHLPYLTPPVNNPEESPKHSLTDQKIPLLLQTFQISTITIPSTPENMKNRPLSMGKSTALAYREGKTPPNLQMFDTFRRRRTVTPRGLENTCRCVANACWSFLHSFRRGWSSAVEVVEDVAGRWEYNFLLRGR